MTKPFEAVVGYLKAISPKKGELDSEDEGQRPFITISRLPGSGGRSLAEAIVNEFDSRGKSDLKGWQVFDHALCLKVAEDPRLKVSMGDLEREEFHSEFGDWVAQLIQRTSPQSEILDRVFKVVRGVAKLGKAIIVGRGGVCLTRGLPFGVHLRLVASKATRIENMMDRYHLDRKSAVRKMSTMERSRATFLRAYFNEDIQDPLLYDAVFNADRLPIAQIARLAADMVCERIRSKSQKDRV